MRSEKLLTKLILVLIEGYTLLLLLWMIASVIPNIGKIKNQLLNGTFNGGTKLCTMDFNLGITSCFPMEHHSNSYNF